MAGTPVNAIAIFDVTLKKCVFCAPVVYNAALAYVVQLPGW